MEVGNIQQTYRHSRCPLRHGSGSRMSMASVKPARRTRRTTVARKQQGLFGCRPQLLLVRSWSIPERHGSTTMTTARQDAAAADSSAYEAGPMMRPMTAATLLRRVPHSACESPCICFLVGATLTLPVLCCDDGLPSRALKFRVGPEAPPAT
jgi:hypothetical protein